jgi:hypothetical protein
MSAKTSEARRVLELCLAPGSKLESITLITSSGQIKGTATALDGDVVVMATRAGKRRIPIASIETLLLHQRSDPPE